MKARPFLACVVAAAMASGCLGRQSFERADALIAQFRQLATAGDTEGISRLGTKQFKASNHGIQLAAMTRAVRGCQAPRRTGTSIFTSTGAGTTITETFVRSCAEGPVVETFVIQLHDKTALLELYSTLSAAAPGAPEPAPGKPPDDDTI